jgi:hypothetical protein
VAVLLLTVVAAGRQSAAGQIQAHAVSQHANNDHQVLFVDGRRSDVLQHVNIVQLAPSSGGTTLVMAKMSIPGTPLMRLIAAALAGTAPKTAVEVATFDYDGQPQDAITLPNARIQEIDLPGMDGSSKNPLRVTVKFFPSLATQSMPSEPMGQLPQTKVALESNFRLAIDGVDCTRVAGIGALTITLPPNLPAGRTKMFGRRPTVTFPPLVVTVSRNFAGPFQQWLASGSPKNGSLTFLSTDMKTSLFVLDFTGLRITTITNETSTGSESIPRSTITMSVSGMSVASINGRSIRIR